MREDCPLQHHLAAHPEIERVRLVWLWPFRSVSYPSVNYNTDMVQITEGWVYDADYTFIGSSADAMRHLEEFDCWDDLDDEDIAVAPVVDGELRITERCDLTRCYGSEDCYEDELPDQEIIESMRSFIVPWEYCLAPNGRMGFSRISYDLGAGL